MNDFWTQAFRQLKADRFRTLLSLLGVAIGIFSIVAALTLVDSVQTSVREGFSAFGSDLLFIDREPLEPDLNEDGVFRWWEYATRPSLTWREYQYVKERGDGKAFDQIAFAAYGQETVGVDNVCERAAVLGAGAGWFLSHWHRGVYSRNESWKKVCRSSLSAQQSKPPAEGK